ncbi:putative iron export permease protein FetB [Candidatus Syntrophocurvum alkaliphilum]|uniref:Putative iron export permease protein FetB n=1 Tax=Candidatus Syntrophocurvum alkaliphilum TaxID=2293317 RepID=A0A6I6DDR9_9FIRM|nr:iron export ABC transporter permease subunit FetB [Candidatus Syntrophocurvum alkaliphilum]QGT98691.1 putative iron export permease protein FetB [Candidatus Syntrophocurvum alkaliphilum]
MADYSYIPITNFQLLLSVSLVFITGLISALLRLGLLKSLLWASFRAFLQLSLIGYVLTYIFDINKLAIIVPIIILMCYIASNESVRRIDKAPHNPKWLAFTSLTASTFIVGIIVVTIIIQPSPWYSAQVAIPIFGMILGNSMNAIALSLDRMYSEVYSSADEVETMLAMGATPWESVNSYMRNAVRAGMTPTINALMVVGLVSLPGMMTGQILAGMDPQVAVRYQFVVMIMIAAAVAIGCLIIIGLSYKKMFTDEMALVEDMRKN